ncbi:MAG: WD40 repeat domain-containing protein [Candidatus Tumulicola sp.]
MFRLRCRNLSWIVVGLLWAGCSGSASTVPPQPSGSPAPPIIEGRGTLAVINAADPNAKRVWIFPTHSDQFNREITVPGSRFQPNSLAFDRRGHLYVGINDTSLGGSYNVVEVNVQSLETIREIRDLPQWSHSSVATDDQNNLYVNTKAFIGGDVRIFRPDTETKPYIEIKDHHSPLTTLVARDALWVGYEGAFSNALARYRLRSTDRTWFQTIGSSEPLALAVNPESSLIATFVRRNSKRAVDVIDVKSGKLARALLEGGRLAGDDERRIRKRLRFGKLSRQGQRLQLPRLYLLFRDQFREAGSARREPARWNALRRQPRQVERPGL